MPLLYWALEDIQQEQVVGGFIITTKSDVASHMWLRWTYTEPQKHLKPVIVRGLTMSTDARFCFVAFCDVEQEEAGDTFTHTFLVPSDDPPAIPATADWPLWEPWGTFLTQNNPWIRFCKDEQPVVTFEDGIIKIADTGRYDVGIALYPPPPHLPLISGVNTPLTINIKCPDATAIDEDTLVYYEVWLNKGPEDFLIYLHIARGSAWDFMGDYGASPPPRVNHCWKYLGTGEHTVDLLTLWQKARRQLGLDPDPAGWVVTRTGFSLTVYPADQTEYVKCDHVGFYHPILTHCNQHPWLECETRYFYFWATSEGQPMKSTSPIFSKHYKGFPPPGTSVYYSDAHPEITSVDGIVRRVVPAQDWANIRNGAGTGAIDTAYGLTAWIRSTNPAGDDKYYELYRSIMLFDLSDAIGKTLLSARIILWGAEKTNEPAINPALGLVSSNPASNTTLIPADYGTLGLIDLASPILYANFLVGYWNFMPLNAAGLAHINAALAGDGIVKLGLREAFYDLANVDPFPGQHSKRVSMSAFDSDLDPIKRPYLEITWA